MFLLLAACIVLPPDGATDKTDTAAPDTGDTDPATDTAAPDTDGPDTDAPDTDAPDTDAPDTDAPDTGPTDTDAPDTGTTDTGPTDTGDTAAPGPAATWCRTLVSVYKTDVQLIAVDMTTGAWVEEARWSGFAGSIHTGGLATDGTSWVFAAYDGSGFRWYSVDAATGVVTRGGVASAVSVAWSGTEWAIYNSDYRELQTFPSFADLSAGLPSTRVPASGFTRLGVDGAEVYGAWHSTSTVVVHDLATGAHLRDVPLEDWDTWVWGVSVAGGKLHLIDDGREYPDTRIASFDPVAGTLIERVLLTGLRGRASGLWCSTTPP